MTNKQLHQLETADSSVRSTLYDKPLKDRHSTDEAAVAGLVLGFEAGSRFKTRFTRRSVIVWDCCLQPYVVSKRPPVGAVWKFGGCAHSNYSPHHLMVWSKITRSPSKIALIFSFKWMLM
ncbi:hypothetical protein AVEN_251767-1 [Araneus ventricosus]|uniref:Uncharacterized protein n=1 Tax=Araneus ventricosus TaxID=182803 RepID=A0A4Y2TR03_ARAVE|nr:hypothetical protein AVEN_251767-1 [Araneus ventricosus]